MLRYVSLSGTPKRILGKKSKKVCVTAIATISAIMFGGITGKNNKSKSARLLTCSPGREPVSVPSKHPTKINTKSSIKQIHLLGNNL